MRSVRILGFVAAAAAVVTLGRPAVAADGAESVEALMKQMGAAAKAGNAGDVLMLIHPDDRPMYGFGMVMVGSFTPMSYMNDEKKAEAVSKEWDALLVKHKLDKKPDDAPPSQDPAEMKMRARALFKGVDLKAFVNDAAAFIKKHRTKDDKNPLIPAPTGAPEKLKLEGDTATATIEGKEEKFSKVDGRWYIHVDM
jgi:hypothetical protein